jgi:hypothetical protein
MIKKIFMWTVYAGIVGLLVFGAINRTSAKTDQGVLLGRPEEAAEFGQGGRGEGNLGQTNEFEITDHEENPEEHMWIELTGVLIGFDSKTLLIQIDNEDVLELSGRAWRFVQETGYVPTLGVEVKLSGFYENAEFKIAGFQDQYYGQVVQVRDDSGAPLWR